MKFIVQTLIVMSLIGCRTPSTGVSKVKDLAADSSKSTKNIFLMLGGRMVKEDELAAYQRLMPQVRVAFQELTLNRGFEIREQLKLTKKQILDMTEAAARDVGENGTLIWYVSSHGYEGLLRSYDKESIQPKEIVEALTRGRSFFDKKSGKKVLKPLRRFYMFHDYCEAEVTVKEIDEATRVEAFDLSLQRQSGLNDNSNALSVIAAAGPKRTDEGLALTAAQPLFSEGFLFSVAAKKQITRGSTFPTALRNALVHFKSDTKVTVGEFFQKVSEEVAKIKVTIKEGEEEIEVAQTAVFYALPTNAILQETLFASTKKRYANSAKPCPPYQGSEWNFAHGRDSSGRCIDPKSRCTCFHVKEDERKSCQLRLPENLDKKMVGEVEEFDEGTTDRCYNVCDKLAVANKEVMKTVCGESLLMANPLKRLETWSYGKLLQ